MHIVESARTKVTAAPMPIAVSTFFETPRKGQIPRNCERTTFVDEYRRNEEEEIVSHKIYFFALSLFFRAMR